MGNKIGRRRQVVDEKYTRPQGLYQLRDIDLKKLRKLILDAKLAPCYPGDDDGHTLDLEECPICFLYFPSLNRSRCCTKGICTECFLQMKPSYSTRLAQCPFCKTPNYAVEYRGAKTREEKGVEQVEEQLVIEAQIRMQQQELQNAKGKLRKKEESSSSRRALSQPEVECQDVSGSSHSVACFRCSTQDDEAISSQRSCIMPISERPSHSRQIGEDNFNLEFEDMMIMEAVWISIQEQGIERSLSASGSTLAEPQLFSEDCYNRDFTFPVEPSPSGGLACRTAALSESHHMSCGLSTMSNSALPVAGMLQSANFPPREDRVIGNYPAENWAEDLEENRRFPSEQNRWMAMDPGSIRVESRTFYTSSDITINAGLGAQPLLEEVSMASGNVVPGNFEDQMMITVAASVVEAGARMNPHALTWL